MEASDPAEGRKPMALPPRSIPNRVSQSEKQSFIYHQRFKDMLTILTTQHQSLYTVTILDWLTNHLTFYLLCIKCFQYFPQSSVGQDRHLTTPAIECWSCQLSLNISACEHTSWWASHVDLKDFYAFMRLHLFTLSKLNLEFSQWAYIVWMQMHIKITINIILRQKSGKTLILDILFIPRKTFI